MSNVAAEEIPLVLEGIRSHATDRRVAGMSPAPLSSKMFRGQGHGPCPTVLPVWLVGWMAPGWYHSGLVMLRRWLETPSVAAGKSLPRSQCCAAASEGVEGASSMLPLVTFLVHCLTVLINSEMTMSTHFRQGSLIFFTCFFTMVSKAMSGVKRPVLNTQGWGQDKAGG